MADNSISRSQQLLRDMEAKYGSTPKSEPVAQPVQQPAPQEAPQPVQQAPETKPGVMLGGAINALGGRAKQIDKAAGYACGGKVKAHEKGGKVLANGKIVGPGTATSDSIPAKVSPTGEDILVGNGERIITPEQDKLIERIAQMLGFETVDAMFEQMTGKPVGPTMKDGKLAARYGANGEWIPDDPVMETNLSPLAGQKQLPVQPLPPNAGRGVMETPIEKSVSASFENFKTGNKPGDTPVQDKINLHSAPQMSADPNSAVSKLISGTQENYPQNTSGSYTAPAVQKRGRDANGVITAESANALYSDANGGGLSGMKSGSFNGSMDLAAQNERMAQSLGYGGTADFNKQFKDRAETVRGGVGIIPDQNEIDNAEKTRRWMVEDQLGKGGRLGAPSDASMVNNLIAQEASIAGSRLRGDQQAQQAQQQRVVQQPSVDPLDSRRKQLEVSGLEEMANLRGKALSGDQKAMATLNALSGKDLEKDRFQFFPGGEKMSEDGFTKVRTSPYLLDKHTGQVTQVGSAAQDMPSFASPADMSAAKAAGKIKVGQTVMTPNGPMVVK